MTLLPASLRHSARFWQVLRVLAAAYLGPRLPFRRGPFPDGPVRMRLALEQLGGAWVKLGQMLALRFDLLPAAYCDELFKLLNEVRPFPYPQVREIVRQELGADPESVFRVFDTKPLASASIGQVHRAVLPTGEQVAVKVQRPGIRQLMQADIGVMYRVARVLDWTSLLGATRTRAVVDEFARWTADELDYLVEARHAVLLYDHARGDRIEHIPRIFPEYTTSRVLTSDLIEGIPLIEIMYARRAHNGAYLAALAERGYDLDAIVRHVEWNMLNQVYVFGYFHADLHPANLFVLPGNAIGYVDFGMVGQLPEIERQSLARYSWLLFQRNLDAAIGELMRWVAPSSETNDAAARDQLVRAHQAFLYNISTSSTVSPFSRLAADIMKIVRENHLTVASSVVAYLKMLVTIGTLRHQLASSYDVSVHVRRFFEGMMRKEAASWLNPTRLLERAYEANFRVQRALEFVEFLESQQAFIEATQGSVRRIEGRVKSIGRRLVSLGIMAVVVAAALYFVLDDPTDTQAMVPQVPYTLLHVALLILLLVILLGLVRAGLQILRR